MLLLKSEVTALENMEFTLLLQGIWANFSPPASAMHKKNLTLGFKIVGMVSKMPSPLSSLGSGGVVQPAWFRHPPTSLKPSHSAASFPHGLLALLCALAAWRGCRL